MTAGDEYMMMIDCWKIPYIGKMFRDIVVKNEGGEKTSASLRRYTRKYHNVNVGLYSYGGCFCDDFNSGGKVNIGRYCSIAMNVHYLAGNHPMDYISTSPYFYQKDWGRSDVVDITRTDLVIGNDCWIGYGVIITPGCYNIGDGSIIGAGSVVTKDVEPFSIVAGNPARVIRKRFEPTICEKIKRSKWWELEPDRLLGSYEHISDIEDFLYAIK